MDPQKLVDLQVQMRHNQDEYKEYLREMESWEKEIKCKEEQLVSKQAQVKDAVSLPPVRNSLTKKIMKKKKKQPKQPEPEKQQNKQRKIRGNDYRSWDKFDVEKACDEVDEEKKSSSSEYETDEEMEEMRKKQLANNLKDEGNQYFKKEQYDMAIECYTKGLELDSDNTVLLLNRAMALLKQEKFGAAEQDCSKAIILGTKDTKAWFRRGSALEALKRYKDALNDFEKVIQLDPRNKAAQTRIDAIKIILNPESVSNVIKTIYIPPEKRSKKPLRRIAIEEIGIDDDQQQDYHMNAKTREVSDFDRFLVKSSSTECSADKSDKSDSTVISEVTEALETQEKSCKRKQPENIQELNPEFSLSNRIESEEFVGTKSVKISDELSAKCRKEQEGSQISKTELDCFTVPPVKKLIASEGKSEGFLTIPQNSCQFQAHWKILRKKSSEFFHYFRQIDPKNFRSLFTVAFDDELLTKIIDCLKEYYISENIDIFPVLDQLTKVQRFSTIVMFLSAKYKKVLTEIFAHVLESLGDHTEAEVLAVKKLYEL